MEFLVVENTKTGNVTFVAGAKEDVDDTETDTALRELREELGISAEEVRLRPTDVRHEFVFDTKKVGRAGHQGSYQIFLADVTEIDREISPTKELRNIRWLIKDEALGSLSFPDLKEVFLKSLMHVAP